MSVAKRGARFDADLSDFAPIESTAALLLVEEAAPIDKFHRIVHVLAFDVVRENSHDIRMIELDEALDLGLKSLLEMLFLSDTCR